MVDNHSSANLDWGKIAQLVARLNSSLVTASFGEIVAHFATNLLESRGELSEKVDRAPRLLFKKPPNWWRSSKVN
jgi:hypothetical protein